MLSNKKIFIEAYLLTDCSIFLSFLPTADLDVLFLAFEADTFVFTIVYKTMISITRYTRHHNFRSGNAEMRNNPNNISTTKAGSRLLEYHFYNCCK